MQLTPLYADPGSSAGAPTDWWLPPPPGWLKLNFNGAFNHFTDRARVGGVIGDLYGNLISAFSCEIRAQNPLEAELIALRRRLLRCHDLQLSKVQVEGDCLALVTSIQNSAHLTWDMMGLMNLLAAINNWTIHYYKRSPNGLADLLAKLDALVVANNASSLPIQARDTYIDECDRVHKGLLL